MAGIYIHIPFCKKKCTYCDFHFSTTFELYRSEMIDSICLEIKQRQEYLQRKEIKTIYFGGGTPSILLESELKQIIKTIDSLFSVTLSAEISIEVNPDDISPNSLELWKRNGINRLSIGLQSFKQSDLDWMNRSHTLDQSFSCVKLAKKHGFKNINVDLIYGLPNLSIDEWTLHLNHVIELGVSHVSAYCLTIEEQTILSKKVSQGKIKIPNEEVQSDQFLKLHDLLKEKGFHQYEISNFSKEGFESQHNSNYWKGEWYMGAGPSAHSFNGHSRSWNIANNTQYIKALKEQSEYNKTEELSKENQFNERLLVGLRTIYGVNLIELYSLNNFTEKFEFKLNNFIQKNWIIRENNILTLTREGKLRADYITSELFI